MMEWHKNMALTQCHMHCSLQYEESRNVEELVEFLIDILDTPEKITLLTEIRYISAAVLHTHCMDKCDPVH